VAKISLKPQNILTGYTSLFVKSRLAGRVKIVFAMKTFVANNCKVFICGLSFQLDWRLVFPPFIK
jgi:hypothetical protein